MRILITFIFLSFVMFQTYAEDMLLVPNFLKIERGKHYKFSCFLTGGAEQINGITPEFYVEPPLGEIDSDGNFRALKEGFCTLTAFYKKDTLFLEATASVEIQKEIKEEHFNFSTEPVSVVVSEKNQESDVLTLTNINKDKKTEKTIIPFKTLKVEIDPVFPEKISLSELRDTSSKMLNEINALKKHFTAGISDPVKLSMVPLSFREKLNISLEPMKYKDADIREVLETILKKVECDYLIDKTINGKVTLQLNQQKAMDVIQLLSESYGFTLDFYGNIIKLKKTLPSEIVTRIIEINPTNVLEIRQFIKSMLSPEGKITLFSSEKTLVVTDVFENVQRIENVLSNFDRNSLKYIEPEALNLYKRSIEISSELEQNIYRLLVLINSFKE